MELQSHCSDRGFSPFWSEGFGCFLSVPREKWCRARVSLALQCCRNGAAVPSETYCDPHWGLQPRSSIDTTPEKRDVQTVAHQHLTRKRSSIQALAKKTTWSHTMSELRSKKRFCPWYLLRAGQTRRYEHQKIPVTALLPATRVSDETHLVHM